MADKLFLCVCYKQVLEFLNFLKMKQVSPKIKWRPPPQVAQVYAVLPIKAVVFIIYLVPSS